MASTCRRQDCMQRAGGSGSAICNLRSTKYAICDLLICDLPLRIAYFLLKFPAFSLKFKTRPTHEYAICKICDLQYALGRVLAKICNMLFGALRISICIVLAYCISICIVLAYCISIRNTAHIADGDGGGKGAKLPNFQCEQYAICGTFNTHTRPVDTAY